MTALHGNAADGSKKWIALSDRAQIRDWSAALGASELELLQAAVEKVDPIADNVQRFLAKA